MHGISKAISLLADNCKNFDYLFEGLLLKIKGSAVKESDISFYYFTSVSAIYKLPLKKTDDFQLSVGINEFENICILIIGKNPASYIPTINTLVEMIVFDC